MQVDTKPNVEPDHSADSLRQAYTDAVFAMCKHDPTARTEHIQIRGVCFTPAVVDTVLGKNTNGTAAMNLEYAKQSGEWLKGVLSGDQLRFVIAQKKTDLKTGKAILGDLEIDLARALRAVSAAWRNHNGNGLKPIFEAGSATALVKGLVHEQLNQTNGTYNEEAAAVHAELTLDKYKEGKAKAKEITRWFADLPKGVNHSQEQAEVTVFQA